MVPCHDIARRHAHEQPVSFGHQQEEPWLDGRVCIIFSASAAWSVSRWPTAACFSGGYSSPCFTVVNGLCEVEGIWWQLRLSVLHSGQGICSVEGLFKQGSWNILVFPASQFQAKQAVDFNLNNHAKTSRVDVLRRSQINWITSRRSHGWTCVCGIIFSASSAWTVLPLANSGVLRRQLQFTVLHSCERLVCG